MFISSTSLRSVILTAMSEKELPWSLMRLRKREVLSTRSASVFSCMKMKRTSGSVMTGILRRVFSAEKDGDRRKEIRNIWRQCERPQTRSQRKIMLRYTGSDLLLMPGLTHCEGMLWKKSTIY